MSEFKEGSWWPLIQNGLVTCGVNLTQMSRFVSNTEETREVCSHFCLKGRIGNCLRADGDCCLNGKHDKPSDSALWGALFSQSGVTLHITDAQLAYFYSFSVWLDVNQTSNVVYLLVSEICPGFERVALERIMLLSLSTDHNFPWNTAPHFFIPLLTRLFK